LRPEIEEDYRQIKDFWKIEAFRSTKYTAIAFHIVTVLIGYMFFQVYRTMDVGQQYAGKCLQTASKKYVTDKPLCLVIYAGQYFGTFGFYEFILLYESLSADVKERLKFVLSKL
jgi:hypothetical protein